MPATPAIASKTVVGTLRDPDGSAVSGAQLRFQPSTYVADVTGHVVLTRSPLFVTTDGSGSFSIELSVTDDPDAVPQDWTWHLTELIPDGREIDFLLPSSSPSTVDISTIMPAQDVPAVYQYASIVQVSNTLETVVAIEDALNDRMDNLETEAGVRLADVITTSATWTCPVGVYVVDAEIIGAGGGGAGSGTGWPNSATGNSGGAAGSGGGAGIDRLVRGISVVPLTGYAVTVGAGGTAGIAPPSIGTDGGNGAAGGYSQAFGYRADGGAGGIGGAHGFDGGAPSVTAGGFPSGGQGGAGNGVNGGKGGSFGAAATSGGAASPLPSANAPAGGSGGGAGSGAGGTPGSNGGAGGTGGGASSGVLAGTAGVAGGSTGNQHGTAGTAGAAGNHPGNGGGGAGGGGSAGLTGGGVTGTAGAGAAGGAGYRGEVRIVYGGTI